MLIFTFNDSNINRRSFARSYWCELLLVLIVLTAAVLLFTFGDDVIDALQSTEIRTNQALPAATKLPASTAATTAQASRALTDTPPATHTTVATSRPTEKPSPAADKNSISPEFRKAMDNFEQFCDEYVDFMNRYAEKGAPASMLMEYLSLLHRYTETMEALAAYEEHEMTDAEAVYYLQVVTRINAKLASIL